MLSSFKWFASKLPGRWQQELKRLHFRQQLQSGRFTADEQEFELLTKWVSPGDWVIDIGANVGHYTARLSQIVGSSGRVIALEPVPTTFELLAATAASLPLKNVTLLNLAASDVNATGTMSIPKFDTGLDNYYRAQLDNNDGTLRVLCVKVDELNFPSPITLIKIDAEGHELSALKGLKRILNHDSPVLIVEESSSDVTSFLETFGYRPQKLSGSCNVIFECVDK